ncbi:MAG: hypothetical protein ACLSE8_14425 [Parasutterella sp.]
MYYRRTVISSSELRGDSLIRSSFPMIPMIWLIDIWLINWWFMDGWPGWKLTMRTAEEAEAAEKEVEERAVWRTDADTGLGMYGIAVGIAFYFAVVWVLPICSKLFTLVD